jgi:malonyl-CoA decarboxylase
MATDSTLTGRLRRLVGPNMMPRIWGDRLQDAQTDPAQLSHTLMTARGQASGVAIADEVLNLLDAADDAAIARYFAALRDEFEVDISTILAAADAARDGGPAEWKALQLAAEPPRQELFRRLNMAPNGTGRLVRLRERLLQSVRRDATLAPIDSDLRHLLRSWFNRGFLVPTRIDWNTPAAILEKIIAYEAVHAIDDWDALRQRLAPADRRCFAFFHPAMRDEPLIFVEVALTRGIAGSIQGILETPRDTIVAAEADTAVFYSISNCQGGLAGISFGAFLIKQVAADLKAELPNLKAFATLSPVPGLAAWAGSDDVDAETSSPAELAAEYLVHAKNDAGLPLDAVARFHLGNGAELHRINAEADISDKGRAQSFGVMVNYLYELDQVEARHEAFAAKGEIAVSRQVRGLLPKRPTTRPRAS